MERQCGHWDVGWVFLRYWQGCTIWHRSWLVGGLHPTLGDCTLIWAFHKGTKLRKKGRLPPQLLKANTAWRWGMGVSFTPRNHEIPMLILPSQPDHCTGASLKSLQIQKFRLHSFPDPQNHAIFITKVLEMESEEKYSHFQSNSYKIRFFRG